MPKEIPRFHSCAPVHAVLGRTDRRSLLLKLSPIERQAAFPVASVPAEAQQVQ